MHVPKIRGAIRASVVALAGCAVLLTLALIAILRGRNDTIMSSGKALAAISSLHGVAWPTNSATTAFTIWRYRAEQDRSSRNTETLARLETSDDSFSSWYSKRFGPANEFNKKVVLLNSRAEFHELLEKYRTWRLQFLDETGQLKPAYRPAPMVASFMQEPAVAQREHIPVPKGPVEVW